MTIRLEFDMSKKESARSGLGLGSILTIIFVLAKLGGYVAWSWWVVFAPVWVPVLFILALLFVCALVVAVLD